MRKGLLPALTAVAFIVTSTAAQAQSSIACMYMLLRVYKAELDYCKVPLAKDRLDRFNRMRSNMEIFIRANAKNDPEAMIAGIETNIKRALAGLSSCRSDDFKLAQQAMDQLTTSDNENVVYQNLLVKKDPQAGTCG